VHGAALHPGHQDGDKRILLIDGKAVPHSLARVAKPVKRAPT